MSLGVWKIGRSGFHKRRDRLADTIEMLISEFARRSPGWQDDLLLIDSTPVECARSRETVKRGGQSSLGGALADAADYRVISRRGVRESATSSINCIARSRAPPPVRPGSYRCPGTSTDRTPEARRDAPSSSGPFISALVSAMSIAVFAHAAMPPGRSESRHFALRDLAEERSARGR